jgi:hypothetical protein
MWHLPLRIFLEVVEVSTKPGEVQLLSAAFWVCCGFSVMAVGSAGEALILAVKDC